MHIFTSQKLGCGVENDISENNLYYRREDAEAALLNWWPSNGCWAESNTRWEYVSTIRFEVGFDPKVEDWSFRIDELVNDLVHDSIEENDVFNIHYPTDNLIHLSTKDRHNS